MIAQKKVSSENNVIDLLAYAVNDNSKKPILIDSKILKEISYNSDWIKVKEELSKEFDIITDNTAIGKSLKDDSRVLRVEQLLPSVIDLYKNMNLSLDTYSIKPEIKEEAIVPQLKENKLENIISANDNEPIELNFQNLEETPIIGYKTQMKPIYTSTPQGYIGVTNLESVMRYGQKPINNNLRTNYYKSG